MGQSVSSIGEWWSSQTVSSIGRWGQNVSSIGNVDRSQCKKYRGMGPGHGVSSIGGWGLVTV